MLRQGFNRLVGGFQSRKTHKTQYQERTLVLANHWDGSVQQFYHFFLGYYMPLSLWLDRASGSRISVRDCGPMNSWFDVLPESIDREVVPPGSALHSVIGDRTKHVILQGLDDPETFNRQKIDEGSRSIRRMLGIADHPSTGEDKVLISDRATSENFYHGAESETHMSGRERRHVPNLAEIAELPETIHTIEVVDFAEIDPKEQIRKAQGASTLVGQHGAGLVHMLWMPAGSKVIEISPPLPPQVEHIFERLAKTLGHNYNRVPQADVHAPIDLGNLKGLLIQ